MTLKDDFKMGAVFECLLVSVNAHLCHSTARAAGAALMREHCCAQQLPQRIYLLLKRCLLRSQRLAELLSLTTERVELGAFRRRVGRAPCQLRRRARDGRAVLIMFATQAVKMHGVLPSVLLDACVLELLNELDDPADVRRRLREVRRGADLRRRHRDDRVCPASRD